VTTRRSIAWVLNGLIVIALAIDTYIHLDLAGRYDAIASTTLSQGDLFRAEAVAAVLAGIGVLLRPGWRPVVGFALLVLTAGAAAIYANRYWDIPGFGPIPRMYEPVWFAEKTVAATAEATGVLLAVAALVAGDLGMSPRRARLSIRRTQS
jgi:hypothetical protein